MDRIICKTFIMLNNMMKQVYRKFFVMIMVKCLCFQLMNIIRWIQYGPMKFLEDNAINYDKYTYDRNGVQKLLKPTFTTKVETEAKAFTIDLGTIKRGILKI